MASTNATTSNFRVKPKLKESLHHDGYYGSGLDHLHKYRILNSAALAGNAPLYESEMNDAWNFVKQLKGMLTNEVNN